MAAPTGASNVRDAGQGSCSSDEKLDLESGDSAFACVDSIERHDCASSTPPIPLLKDTDVLPLSGGLDIPSMTSALADVALTREISASPRMQSALSHGTKMGLLAVFSLGLFVDILGFSVFFILLTPTAQDLNIGTREQTWVITSFAIAFSSFLLFWGRVSDLYSPKPVFVFGFIGLGLINLCLSFVTNANAFYALRGLSGVCGSCLVPASFRLMTAVFEHHELNFAFTIYGISGSVANTMGIVLGGAILEIPGTGQMTSWRWYFRIVACVILPFALGSYWWVPETQGSGVRVPDKWKRMDLTGVTLLFVAVLLLILALTFGASYGFDTAKFIAPLVISLMLFPIFVWWESRLPAGFALIEPDMWRYRNFVLYSVMALLNYAWFSMNFVPQSEVYLQVYDEVPIIAALRLVPQGLSTLVMTAVLVRFPAITQRPAVPFVVCTAIGMIAYVLFVLGRCRIGIDYWRFTFPASIIGASTMHCVFNFVNVGALTSVPPGKAGVAGAIIQTSYQIGSAAALSIQGGFLTAYPGGYSNFNNIRLSWFFMLGWSLVWLVVFLVCYRKPKGGSTGVLSTSTAH